jgi:hypothetical protein
MYPQRAPLTVKADGPEVADPTSSQILDVLYQDVTYSLNVGIISKVCACVMDDLSIQTACPMLHKYPGGRNSSQFFYERGLHM